MSLTNCKENPWLFGWMDGTDGVVYVMMHTPDIYEKKQTNQK